MGIWDFTSTNASTGMISFWWKPSYSPERTGKIRSLWDMSRYHDACDARVFVWPFQLWFYPSHYNPGVSEVTSPKYWHNNQGKFNPTSLCGGSKCSHGSSGGNRTGPRVGRMTTCLNHRHQDHKWIKRAPCALLDNTTFLGPELGNDNGAGGLQAVLNGPKPTRYTSGDDGFLGEPDQHFEKHDGGAWNLRLGGSRF